MRLIFLVAFLLDIFFSVARAEERIALVVGNTVFASAPRVTNAAANADSMASALRGLGFDVTEMVDAGRDDLLEAMENFRARLSTGDAVGLFYYSGYAAQFEGSNFLLAVDFDSATGHIAAANVSADGVRLDGLLGAQQGNGLKIVLLDPVAPPAGMISDMVAGLATPQPAQNTIVMISAQPTDSAAHQPDADPVFTDALVQRLSEPGASIVTILGDVRADVILNTQFRQMPEIIVPPSEIPSVRLGQDFAPLSDLTLPQAEDPSAVEANSQVRVEAAERLVAADPGNAALMRDLQASYIALGDAKAANGNQAGALAAYEASGAIAERLAESDPSTTGPQGHLLQTFEKIGDARAAQRDSPGALAAYQAGLALAERLVEMEPDNAAWQVSLSATRQKIDDLTRASSAPGSGGGDPTALDPPAGSASGGSGASGGSFDAPEQQAIPLDSAEGGGGGSGGSTLGEEPTLPDMAAPGSGGDDYTYLDNLGATFEEQEHYQEQAAREEQAVREAQKRFEEELAREQEMAKASAEQAEAEESAPPDAAVEPLPSPPPTTAGPFEQPAAVEMIRHPTLDAPEAVISGQEFTVSVALTEDQVTPDVMVRAGPESSVTPEGALAFSLPASAEEWPIDIDLLAAGFDLTDAGAWSRRVMLYRVGDSDFARFTLKPRAVREDSKPRQLIARLYHEGRFLGSVSRPVIVFRDQVAMDNGAAPGEAAGTAPATLLTVAGTQAETPAQALTTDVRIDGSAEDVPDLDVTIHYSDPDELGDGLIILHSPHIGAPVSAEFTTPEGMNAWLDSGYMRLVTLGLQVRGAKPLQGQAASASKEFVTRVAEGFGSDLYRNYVPGAFKDVFWSLKARDMLHSIQITSNSPVLPWELVRPEAADGTPDGFLGIKYRLARWAPRSTGGQVDRPLDRLPFTGVATVAPAYDNNLELPFQKVEVDALRKLAGFRLVDGDFSSFERLVGEVSTGFIHFSGHGEVNDPGTGSPVFAIQLLDQALDPTTWRALTFAPHDKGNPFFFFNACDTGRARSLGGFVQGWGPAVLVSGASGFIGGMWPLTDQTAASFSTSFYGGIADHLKDGPVYLAEVLQVVRQRFYETGDPTYLAYTFYGNANLQIVSE